MRPTHWLILIIVVIVVFGASKLPEIAKSLGQSAKILKKEMKDLREDDDTVLPELPQARQPESDRQAQTSPEERLPQKHLPEKGAEESKTPDSAQ